MIQFLVKHGHKWFDIKEYSLSELGVFIREAAAEEKVNFETKALASWVGFNYDHKSIKNLTTDSNLASGSANMSRKTPEQDPDAVMLEWKRAASAISKLR